ncbi:unnamed protein product [Cuscuta europaea]|uniref:Uncharacterized protein n=1 Tax=Cuscuta europaea TaxID=41803 RepID=A0A9P0ZEZ0_CUSEU|nr:unnamed protein product [Cuscuta europaea]
MYYNFVTGDNFESCERPSRKVYLAKLIKDPILTKGFTLRQSSLSSSKCRTTPFAASPSFRRQHSAPQHLHSARRQHRSTPRQWSPTRLKPVARSPALRHSPFGGSANLPFSIFSFHSSGIKKMKKGIHPQLQWISYVTQSGRLMPVMMTKIHQVGKVYHFRARRQMAESIGQIAKFKRRYEKKEEEINHEN